VLDADAVQPDGLRPAGERVGAVVGDDDEACPEAQVGGELACGGEEAEDLAACPRGVVGEPVADRSGGALRERGVGVGLDLELERRVWWRELEQLVEQKRRLLAWRAVALTQPPGPDLLRGVLAAVWAVILIVAHRRTDSQKRNTIRLMCAGWWFGWTSAGIARVVYPPPKKPKPEVYYRVVRASMALLALCIIRLIRLLMAGEQPAVTAADT
jgi:hypothetical protein